MLRLAHSLRRELRHAPAASPRAFHLHRTDIAMRVHGPRCEEPLPRFDPDYAVKPRTSQNPELKPLIRPASEASPRVGAHPPYRAGDGEAAILVRMQARVLITVEGEDQAGLRIHPDSSVLPKHCCNLPGVNFARYDPAISGHGPERSPGLAPQYIPGVLLEDFWNSLPGTMSEQGRDLFEHFNTGQSTPTSVAQCYQRLQAYVDWLCKLSD